MKNTIIYLLGFPGTGKLTVAKEICKAADVKLVDNHLINNPIFSLIHHDGKTPLPPEVWQNTGKVRTVVLETIQNISPPDFSFVLTNMLIDEDLDDHDIYRSVESLARARNAKFVPIRLLCDLKENMRRIVRPDRIENMKEADPKSAKRRRETQSIIKVNHSNSLDLDITDIAPNQAAAIILDHARSLAQPD